MNWPARCSKLNRVEHLWDNTERRLRKIMPPLGNLNNMAQQIRQMWHETQQKGIRTLINNMPHRCQAVIRSRGRNTRY
ncbi:hypothetical protein BDFB_010673 [Asbolus verrucosus]|uniref:DDE 3 domain containing protein n=1 Tax=Asbolus verrucosus TaxID=1661398 RepID=A0A482VS33_ASBVE|nr:hypothetical protein BDFB_010673 [Asbolus verrucosus]